MGRLCVTLRVAQMPAPQTFAQETLNLSHETLHFESPNPKGVFTTSINFGANKTFDTNGSNDFEETKYF